MSEANCPESSCQYPGRTNDYCPYIDVLKGITNAAAMNATIIEVDSAVGENSPEQRKMMEVPAILLAILGSRGCVLARTIETLSEEIYDESIIPPDSQ